MWNRKKSTIQEREQEDLKGGGRKKNNLVERRKKIKKRCYEIFKIFYPSVFSENVVLAYRA